MKKYILIQAAVMLICSFMLSCGNKELNNKSEALSLVHVPQTDQGVITFITGYVQKFQNNEWVDMEINDFVDTGDKIRVEPDSFCEIQFGNTAVIKIEENTEMEIPLINTVPGKSEIGIKMITGSVLSKVNKLTENESFSVSTQSAACGVRGTQFMVSAGGEADTLLAVKEGSVAIIPSKFDIESLLEKMPLDKKEFALSVENIKNFSTLISAGEEMEIAVEDIKEIEKTYNDLEKTVALYSKSKKDSRYLKEIESLSGILVKELSLKASLKNNHREKMEYLGSMVIRKLPIEEGKDVADNLVIIDVSVNVSDARIIRNNQVIGFGGFSSIVDHGEDVSLIIRKRGYFDKELSFTASKYSKNKYNVSLEKDPDAKEFVVMEIKADPSDAEIIINGITEGSGTLVKEMLTKKEYDILVKKNGYQKKRLGIVNPDKNGTVEIKLLPSIERKIKVSDAALTGYTVFSNGKIFTADTYGEVCASNPKGKILWKQQTGNSPNERAFPVSSGNRIYFSGANIFATFDAASGTVINSQVLEDDAAHVFGRRVVFAGEKGIYPANSSLIKFSPKTGDFNDRIEIPGGTRMTPSYYKNELLLVNQKGVFLRIDPVSGKIKKQIKTTGLQPVVNNVAVYNDKAYFNGRKGKVICIDLLSNTVKWSREIVPGKTRMVTGDLQCNGKALFAYSEGKIYVLSSETGKKLSSPISGVSSPPVVSGKKLFYGTTNSLFVTADADTGKTIDTVKINSRITASPAFSGGKVYAGTSKGRVLVINP